MKSHSIPVLILLCIYFNNIPAMEQRPTALPPTQGPATAAAVGATQELPPIFIGQQVPRFPIRGEAVAYSRTLQTMRDVVNDSQQNLYPIAQYSDQQLDFVARLINFLYTEQQKTGSIDNDRVIAFITTHTNSYRNIPFNQVLELINFFDIPDAFIAITSVQPLPLPTTPAQEIEYNKQLTSVFNLARSTTIASQGNIKVGNENLWQLFGRMLYPNYTKYPEVVKMIDFITTKRGGIFVRTVRTIGRKVGSWPGTYQPSENTVQKKIEHIVLGAYMQQHQELFEHPLQELRCRTNVKIKTIAFSPDGTTLASAGADDTTIRLWNLTDGSVKLLRGHTHGISSVAFSPDGSTLASGSGDATIRLWNVKKGSSEELRDRTTGPILSVAFSPDGQTLALTSGWSSNTIRLWNLVDGSAKVLRGNAGPIDSVIFGLDGITLTSSSNVDVPLLLNDLTIQLWNRENGSLQVLKRRTNYTRSVAFSPDGRTHASSLADHSIELWNLANGSSRIFRGHTRPISSITFSPDGKMLASNSFDNTIRLWNLADSSSRIFRCHTDHIGPIVFSPYGTLLASSTQGDTIQLHGYKSLREALQAPIAPTRSTSQRPVSDESSAAPSAPILPTSPR